MSRRGWILGLLSLALAGCLNSVPTPPEPPAPVLTPVGRWRLDTSSDQPGLGESDELTIASDGTFSNEPQISGLRLRSRFYSLTTGTWSFADPTLTINDVTIGGWLLRLETDPDGGAQTALTDLAGLTVFLPE